MMRKPRFRFLVALSLLAIGVCISLFASPVVDWMGKKNSLKSRFDSVKIGMTIDQVIEVVGRPPGIYLSCAADDPDLTASRDLRNYNFDHDIGYRWIFDDAHIVVMFHDQKVSRVTDYGPLKGDRPLLQRIRGLYYQLR